MKVSSELGYFKCNRAHFYYTAKGGYYGKKPENECEKSIGNEHTGV